MSLAFLSAPASAQFTAFDRTDDLPSYHREGRLEGDESDRKIAKSVVSRRKWRARDATYAVETKQDMLTKQEIRFAVAPMMDWINKRLKLMIINLIRADAFLML